MGNENLEFSEDIAEHFGKDIAAQARLMVTSGRRMNLKSDAAFKLFFSSDTPEAKACLRYFLSAATGRTVTEADVTNTELLPVYIGMQRPRLDVNCVFDSGQRADIELQLSRDKDDQLVRSVYYACKLFSGALKEGQLYANSANTYQIFLIDFNLFKDDKFYHRGMFRLDDGTPMTEKLQVRFFGFPNLAKKNDGEQKTKDVCLKKMRNWCTFIEGCNNSVILERLARDASWQEEFDMAMAASIHVSEEEKAWAYHLSYDRAKVDYDNEMMLTRQEGVRQGVCDTALRMLSKGKYSQEEIADMTGLSVKEVQQLQNA